MGPLKEEACDVVSCIVPDKNASTNRERTRVRGPL